MKLSFTSILVLLSLLTLPVMSQNDQSKDKTKMDEAQHYALAGAHSFHLGAGFPNKIGLGLSSVDLIDNFLGTQQIEGGYTTPQFTLRYEYTMNEELGFGVHLGYWQAETPTLAFGTTVLQPQGGLLGELIEGLCDEFPEQCELVEETLQGSKQIRSFSVGGQITYHKQVLPKINTYASAVLGYNFLSEKNVGDPSDRYQNLNLPTIVYFTSVGVRYYFSPAIGIYGEVGYGNISNFNVGLTYRIP